MKVRYTFRCYPTYRQARHLAREFGNARHVYNFALRLRTDSFKNGKPVNYNASSAALTKHRADPDFVFLLTTSSVPQQQALRHLQTAFSNFFAKRTAYPKFASKHGKQSAEYTVNGFKWDAANRNLTISKVGRLHVKWSRGFTSEPTTCTITKGRDGRYFVSLCLDEPAKAALPKTGSMVGIDLGISRLATLAWKQDLTTPDFGGTVEPCHTKTPLFDVSSNEPIKHLTKPRLPNSGKSTIKGTKSELPQTISGIAPKIGSGFVPTISGGGKQTPTGLRLTGQQGKPAEDFSSPCAVAGSVPRNTDIQPALQVLTKSEMPLTDIAIIQRVECQNPTAPAACILTTATKLESSVDGSAGNAMSPLDKPETPSKPYKVSSRIFQKGDWTIERIANPRHTARYATRLTRLQRVLARRKKGSGRWNSQRLKVARLNAKIANSRKDTLDKLTTDLVRRFDILAIEDLNVRGMVKNKNLAKHISCASFGQFRPMLTYKCAWYGRELRVADRFFPSSKRCNSCGHIHASLGLEIREFKCENCGERLDRDQNAAKNILQFAKATTGGQPGCQGHGERVSRAKASASARNARRSVNQPSSANV